MALPLNKNDLDVAKILTAYTAFLGDEEKTSMALEIPLETVHALAQAEDWPTKIKQWHDIRDGNPKDVQVQINRAINFVQSHRLRCILDKFVHILYQCSPNELKEMLTVTTKYGQEIKTRALTDLVKAAESVQLMTQRALGDTAEERPDASREAKGSRIMLDVANAMSAAEETKLDSANVVKKELGLNKPGDKLTLPDDVQGPTRGPRKGA